MARYNRDFLIREIAARANFTIGDVKIIFKEFEEIVKEIVQEKDELAIPGLFLLSVGEIKEHEGVNPKKNERIQILKSNRIKIKASRMLYDLLPKDK